VSTDHTSEADIRRLLESGASDEAVCDAFDHLLTSLNGPTATVHRLAAAGFILNRRPHLAEPVLEVPVDGYLVHGNLRPDGIIRNGVAKSDEGWVQQIAGPDGVRWLREELPKLEGLLGRLLWETEVLRWLVTYQHHPPMTEEAWLTCEDAERMWQHLRRLGRPPYRKRVLLAAEVCRIGAMRFREPGALHAVIRRFEARAERGFAGDATGALPPLDASLSDDCPDMTVEESRELAPRVRDLFGNPFRPVYLDPSCLTDSVLSLAAAADDQRQKPEGILDSARLLVLADALEEAGCTDQTILDHLRGPGPHVRGCWPVDLVLSKSPLLRVACETR
jgi:hypothetical protein